MGRWTRSRQSEGTYWRERGRGLEVCGRSQAECWALTELNCYLQAFLWHAPNIAQREMGHRKHTDVNRVFAAILKPRKGRRSEIPSCEVWWFLQCYCSIQDRRIIWNPKILFLNERSLMEYVSQNRKFYASRVGLTSWSLVTRHLRIRYFHFRMKYSFKTRQVYEKQNWTHYKDLRSGN